MTIEPIRSLAGAVIRYPNSSPRERREPPSRYSCNEHSAERFGDWLVDHSWLKSHLYFVGPIAFLHVAWTVVPWVSTPITLMPTMRSKILLGFLAFAVLATAITIRRPKSLSDFDQSFYLTIAYDLDRHGVFSNGVFDNVDSTREVPPPGM